MVRIHLPPAESQVNDRSICCTTGGPCGPAWRRDHLLNSASVKLAPANPEHGVYRVLIERKDHFILGHCLFGPVLGPQDLTFGEMSKRAARGCRNGLCSQFLRAFEIACKCATREVKHAVRKRAR
jgi:hypothetical protein